MSDKLKIYPAEVRSYAKLDNVLLHNRQYVWIRAYLDYETNESVQIEMTLLDGNLVINCPPEFAEHIKIVPYTKDGHAPGMENVRFIR